MKLSLNILGLSIAAGFDRAQLDAAMIDRAARAQVKAEIRAAQVDARAAAMRAEQEARAAAIAARAAELRAQNGSDPAANQTTNRTA